MPTRFARIGPSPRIALDWGGSGPLVVLLHGIGGNRQSWKAQLPALTVEFTAAAWDARGYLDSDDYSGPLEFSELSQDLLRVLDAFGAPRAHLVGTSMGGRVALHFVDRYPERVASLVLADTSAGSAEQGTPERIESFLRLRRQPLIEGKTPADIAPQIARTLVGPNCPSEVLQEVIAGLAGLRRDSYLKALECTTRFNDFPRYETIRVPALVMVGEYDRLATPAFAAQVAQQLPAGSLEVLAGVGHLSNQEDPSAFNAALLKFLRRHRDRAPAARSLRGESEG
ncbi:MAG TPA: alpha/beta hydrolase [Steroidobacteraceae bacterium]|nr:alpha/beta hydrolase [Steroidobacteraceae bacterium]